MIIAGYGAELLASLALLDAALLGFYTTTSKYEDLVFENGHISVSTRQTLRTSRSCCCRSRNRY